MTRPPRAPAAAALDACHPASALRAVLAVQAALALAALAGADSAATLLARLAPLSLGGLLATLAWLALACVGRRPGAEATARAAGAASTTAPNAVALPVTGDGPPAFAQAAAVDTARPPGLVAVLAAAAGGLALALLAWLSLAFAGAVAGTRWQGAAVAAGGALAGAALHGWLDLRSRAWAPAQAASRLAELQSRIRPHFLFNALNTAIALVRADPPRAEGVLEDLADLFRVALAEPGTSVSLGEEIELARGYLAIEALRFGPRLAVEWDIDPLAVAARVPPLVLQPLVENAVRHGIEPLGVPGTVRIAARVQRGQVVVEVSNPVPPAAPATDRAGHGIALASVRERLSLLHDLGAQCRTWREHDAADGGARFHVRLTVPAP